MIHSMRIHLWISGVMWHSVMTWTHPSLSWDNGLDHLFLLLVQTTTLLVILSVSTSLVYHVIVAGPSPVWSQCSPQLGTLMCCRTVSMVAHSCQWKVSCRIHGHEAPLLVLWKFYFNVIVALSSNLFTPDIIIPGIPTAGDNFNIICRLAGVVERLIGTPLVILSFISLPGGVLGELSQDGSAYIIPRIFNPGETSDVGTYTCAATVISSSGGGFVSTASGILQIRSKCHNIFH